MQKTKGGQEERTDSVDGFLFVGNQLALDFLNTRFVLDGEMVEKLPCRDAFERWCKAASIAAQADHSAASLTQEDSMAEVRAFRERLREAVLAFETGEVPGQRFLDDLNKVLATYPALIGVSQMEGRLTKRTAFAAAQDGAFWGAIAASVAELLTELDPRRIRKCENCVLHFHDISKKGSRLWCSMNLCGNRLKVAAYQRRQRSRRSAKYSDGG
jgi:predicted RNA-binding Zn ribbon-like protein